MLKRTFLHMPGISEKTEQSIWKRGITCWEDARADERLRENAELSLQALSHNDFGFFRQSLPSREHWRAYPHFRTCFLDIETTGLSKDRNRVTTIGMFDGKNTEVLIQGKDIQRFPEILRRFDLIVTFNGSLFDIPFLRQHFPQADLDKLHIDLRFVLQRLGMRGGLKRIEQQVGIVRAQETQGVDGFEAVRLWHAYERRGDEAALRKLVAYNAQDVIHLKTLMEMAYGMMEKNTLADLPHLITSATPLGEDRVYPE